MAAPLLKICGLTQPPQAAAVAALGCDALGVIGVAGSPRFLPASGRPALWQAVAEANPRCRRVLVLVNPSDAELAELNPAQGHQVLQLHGEESPERCAELAQHWQIPVWKALRIREAADLAKARAYAPQVEAVLLDAWVADQYGGSGQRLPLDWLERFEPGCPWWLAGGIGPQNVGAALAALGQLKLQPCGIDASSGVEISPGQKDLKLVAALLQLVRAQSSD
ncbi:MAG: phosphoribosylanthranilate isomerase [Synechococcus lacustris]|jgi:phosphoribosylanthranilate isomerase